MNMLTPLSIQWFHRSLVQKQFLEGYDFTQPWAEKAYEEYATKWGIHTIPKYSSQQLADLRESSSLRVKGLLPTLTAKCSQRQRPAVREHISTTAKTIVDRIYASTTQVLVMTNGTTSRVASRRVIPLGLDYLTQKTRSYLKAWSRPHERNPQRGIATTQDPRLVMHWFQIGPLDPNENIASKRLSEFEFRSFLVTEAEILRSFPLNDLEPGIVQHIEELLHDKFVFGYHSPRDHIIAEAFPHIRDASQDAKNLTLKTPSSN